ncbi:Wzz/FepE/Etk N-terminal domain-containing protein [Streptosporangium sp. NBC_01755]|uniref:YveK family protein n=1 Tax=unclassified Streptosporangium TaxID=2632669 RepID=UPI002DD92273|nr:MULTISPECIES: Wzz/FepE/Etk N-terminal domain-containing protein [unclassified Streptosporangium]WSA26081.1 Wzz/FepE/Etk N-terminal domain-containing protein [Streptosporangium sp. NBC_01810]WSD02490.1 Wzz/FepE/Etk N-terminal domain-containing protein [Streptosporangium sp. NBC_01755]
MSPSPDVPARREGGDLADYASLLRRRWLIICSLLLTGAGGGAALLRLTPPSYTASAQVLVTATGSQEQTNQVTNRQREPLNLDTEAQIARSAVVSAKAREMPGELGCPAEVSVPPNTSVLEISCTATDPRAAASGASAYALAYLAQRRESSTQMLTAQLKAVMVKLRQVNAGLAKVATTLPGLSSGTTERALALQRRDVLGRQAHSLTARYDALRTVAVTPGSVISQAVAPTTPSAPRPPLYLGSGLMAGLLCGVGLAWLRDRLDTALRTTADVRRLTGLDALGDEEMRHLAGAVLVVAVPGTSSRDVRGAVRTLNDRGVRVVGAFVTGGDDLSPDPPAGAARAPHISSAAQPGAARSRRAERPLAGLAGGDRPTPETHGAPDAMVAPGTYGNVPPGRQAAAGRRGRRL